VFPTFQTENLAYDSLMKTQEVTERLQDWQKKIGDTAKNVGKVTDDYVHENTWATIAGAAIVGCLIGFLLGRSRD
jgi:ElaB/YqjD/DUF883 family membrane-anchored ribosome-binding protein